MAHPAAHIRVQDSTRRKQAETWSSSATCLLCTQQNPESLRKPSRARLVLLKCAVKNCVFTRQSHTRARQKCLSVKELSDSSGVSQHTLPVVSPGLLWQRKVSGCVRWSFEVSKRSIRNDDIMPKLLCSIFRLNDVTQYTMTHTHYLWLEANVNITIT